MSRHSSRSRSRSRTSRTSSASTSSCASNTCTSNTEELLATLHAIRVLREREADSPGEKSIRSQLKQNEEYAMNMLHRADKEKEEDAASATAKVSLSLRLSGPNLLEAAVLSGSHKILQALVLHDRKGALREPAAVGLAFFLAARMGDMDGVKLFIKTLKKELLEKLVHEFVIEIHPDGITNDSAQENFGAKKRSASVHSREDADVSRKLSQPNACVQEDAATKKEAQAQEEGTKKRSQSQHPMQKDRSFESSPVSLIPAELHLISLLAARPAEGTSVCRSDYSALSLLCSSPLCSAIDMAVAFNQKKVLEVLLKNEKPPPHEIERLVQTALAYSSVGAIEVLVYPLLRARGQTRELWVPPGVYVVDRIEQHLKKYGMQLRYHWDQKEVSGLDVIGNPFCYHLLQKHFEKLQSAQMDKSFALSPSVFSKVIRFHVERSQESFSDHQTFSHWSDTHECHISGDRDCNAKANEYLKNVVDLIARMYLWDIVPPAVRQQLKKNASDNESNDVLSVYGDDGSDPSSFSTETSLNSIDTASCASGESLGSIHTSESSAFCACHSDFLLELIGSLATAMQKVNAGGSSCVDLALIYELLEKVHSRLADIQQICLYSTKSESEKPSTFRPLFALLMCLVPHQSPAPTPTLPADNSAASSDAYNMTTSGQKDWHEASVVVELPSSKQVGPMQKRCSSLLAEARQMENLQKLFEMIGKWAAHNGTGDLSCLNLALAELLADCLRVADGKWASKTLQKMSPTTTTASASATGLPEVNALDSTSAPRPNSSWTVALMRCLTALFETAGPAIGSWHLPAIRQLLSSLMRRSLDEFQFTTEAAISILEKKRMSQQTNKSGINKKSTRFVIMRGLPTFNFSSIVTRVRRLINAMIVNTNTDLRLAVLKEMPAIARELSNALIFSILAGILNGIRQLLEKADETQSETERAFYVKVREKLVVQRTVFVLELEQTLGTLQMLLPKQSLMSAFRQQVQSFMNELQVFQKQLFSHIDANSPMSNSRSCHVELSTMRPLPGGPFPLMVLARSVIYKRPLPAGKSIQSFANECHSRFSADGCPQLFPDFLVDFVLQPELTMPPRFKDCCIPNQSGAQYAQRLSRSSVIGGESIRS